MTPKLATSLATLTACLIATLPADDYEDPPIRYSTVEPADKVAKLHKQIDSGTFDFDRSSGQKGFLRSVLKKLNVPESSQTLVFSKTSKQNDHITPERPRALYFSDEFYVGWVQNGDIEIIATDPHLGLIFYLLEIPSSEKEKTQIIRDNDCLRCHAGLNRHNVPGVLVRSVFADSRGFPILSAGTFFTDHTSDIKNRWGGWYVTGNHGEMQHMGNRVAKENDDGSANLDTETNGNLETLVDLINTKPYLRDTSDIVSLMILEHQVTAHNALITASYGSQQILHRNRALADILEHGPDELSETTRSVLEHQASALLRAFLFKDEFQLEGFGVEGIEEFQKDFTANARKSASGKSLKDLQLLSHIFKNRCSYMIYDPVFTNLPAPFKEIVFRQLHEILDAETPTEDFQHLSKGERARIKAILLDTLEGFKPPGSSDDNQRN